MDTRGPLSHVITLRRIFYRERVLVPFWAGRQHQKRVSGVRGLSLALREIVQMLICALGHRERASERARGGRAMHRTPTRDDKSAPETSPSE
jgi:hypothetical protein